MHITTDPTERYPLIKRPTEVYSPVHILLVKTQFQTPYLDRSCTNLYISGHSCTPMQWTKPIALCIIWGHLAITVKVVHVNTQSTTNQSKTTQNSSLNDTTGCAWVFILILGSALANKWSWYAYLPADAQATRNSRVFTACFGCWSIWCCMSKKPAKAFE